MSEKHRRVREAKECCQYKTNTKEVKRHVALCAEDHRNRKLDANRSTVKIRQS